MKSLVSDWLSLKKRNYELGRPGKFTMEGLKKPPLVLDSTKLAKTQKSWREEFSFYLDLTMPSAKETANVNFLHLPERWKAKVFTVCGVKHGSWHVTLDEASSYFTTFATPVSRYLWIRMPTGIRKAQLWRFSKGNSCRRWAACRGISDSYLSDDCEVLRQRQAKTTCRKGWRCIDW